MSMRSRICDICLSKPPTAAYGSVSASWFCFRRYKPWCQVEEKIVRTFAGSSGFNVSGGKITTVVFHPAIQIRGVGSILSPSSWETKSPGIFLSRDRDDIASTSREIVIPSYLRMNF